MRPFSSSVSGCKSSGASSFLGAQWNADQLRRSFMRGISNDRLAPSLPRFLIDAANPQYLCDFFEFHAQAKEVRANIQIAF
jgi:hypothetical protein